MEKKIDQETNKIMSDGEKLKGTVESSGWSIMRVRLLKKVGELLNLSDIVNPDPSSIIQVVASRQIAANVLLEWLKDIEGTVEQHKGNSKILSDIVDDYIISIP